MTASVAVVGGGASGVLSALQLALAADSRSQRLDILLAEPNQPGRGVAYSTRDPRHRLNVMAAGMSALPTEPDHFVRWLQRNVDATFPATGYAARQDFGAYLADTLRDTVDRCASVRLQIVPTQVSDLHWTAGRWCLNLSDGTEHSADAVILAVGARRPSRTWAPPELDESPRFVADPWDQQVPRPHDRQPARVVLVGSGLTMADVALSWEHPETELHTVSRHGLSPLPHAAVGPRPAPPQVPGGELSVAALRRVVFDQVRQVMDAGGDWRQAIDSLRPITAELWARLPEPEQVRFLDTAASRWNRVRHRVDPAVVASLARRTAAGSLHAHTGSVIAARETEDAIHLSLSDGSEIAADVVVNCTGPGRSQSSREDLILTPLARSGVLRLNSLGLGVDCEPCGRVISTDSVRRSMWAIGALRQGQLWESTAIPEIRVQAGEIAASVLDSLLAIETKPSWQSSLVPSRPAAG